MHFFALIVPTYNSQNSAFCLFFIGAGCSSSSDIPTATKLVSTWLNKLRNKQDTKLSELEVQGDLSSNESIAKN
jgi:NAD-dependent SIR2 family protein deacetylase